MITVIEVVSQREVESLSVIYDGSQIAGRVSQAHRQAAVRVEGLTEAEWPTSITVFVYEITIPRWVKNDQIEAFLRDAYADTRHRLEHATSIRLARWAANPSPGMGMKRFLEGSDL